MKVELIIILMFISFVSKGQISTLETSKKILVSPEITKNLSSDLIMFYIKDYQKIKSEKEIELSSTISNEKKLSFKKDIETLDKYLSQWISLNEKNHTNIFIENYESTKSYTLETNIGKLIVGEYELKEGKPTLYCEEIEVKNKPASGKWVRERRYKACYPQDPDGCYTVYYEETREMYIILETGQSIFANQLPDIYYFDSVNSKLIREIVFIETGLKVVNKESGDSVIVYDWSENNYE